MIRKKTTQILTRKNNWQSLDSSLYPNSLIARIDVNESGKLVVKRIDWNDYWLTEMGNCSAELNELKQRRMALLAKPDELEKVKEYVMCYFVVIEDIDLTASQLRRYLDENSLINLSIQRLRSGIPNSQTLIVFENK
ncbi:hypothetical protein FACS1894170_09300 [Planctomycetales bacterium]|nr:hypothetical protein FACS1894170_09300 [Planctomycetales bacterium]